VSVKPVVTLWCLPKMTEEQLVDLHRDVVQSFHAVLPQLVIGEESLIVLFPPDQMKHGLGQEVYIEVKDLNLKSVAGGGDSLAGAFRVQLAMELCLCISRWVPKAKVQSCVREFNEQDMYRVFKQSN